MNKSELKNFAIEARLELLQRVTDRAKLYGVDEENSQKKTIVPTERFQKIGGALLTDTEKIQRDALILRVCENGYRQTMEEAAYTWFNRFIALRYMQEHNRLPVPMRVFPDAPGTQPQLLREAQDVDLPGVEPSRILAMLEENQTDELYKSLLIALCNHLSEPLPGMFETISDTTELLFPDGLLKPDSVLGEMAAHTQGCWEDIQVVGWLYQYYISQRHDEVVDINGGAIAKQDIPAATCLYTTDWVVRYMVENSVGRLWLEGHPDNNLRMKWRYYMDEAEQTPDVAARLNDIRKDYADLQPEQITLLDPCMGSGHILVYAFDVLMDIYRSVGYTDRDAVQSIVQNNLYGLDIDDRAAQLAYFAVMMKACDYDRRFLRRGVQPHVRAIQESAKIEEWKLDALGAEKPLAKRLLNTFADAKEYGSILHVNLAPEELTRLRRRMDDLRFEAQTTLTGMADGAEVLAVMEPLLAQAEILAHKYDAVITNPPYMNKFSANMKRFVQENYAEYKADLFAVFMHRNFDFCKENGYSAFMTPFVWMFIKSYEKLREEIIEQKCINTLIQMEYSAFEEATVPICTFVLRNSKLNYKGNYLRLSDFKGGMDVQNEKVLEAQNDPNCKYRHTAQQENFTKIPGHPIAYWVSERVLRAFSKKTIADFGFSGIGMRTGDNERFLRHWHEISHVNMHIGCKDKSEQITLDKRWIPYNKGGDFRKWYGNNEYVVNWWNDGVEIKENTKKVYPYLGDNLGWKISNESYYYKPGITWSGVTSGSFGCRCYNEGFIFDSGANGLFAYQEMNRYYLAGLLNTALVNYILGVINPTINTGAGTVGKIPTIIDERHKQNVNSLVKGNINLSKDDWDSFEISWDFKKHPLI